MFHYSSAHSHSLKNSALHFLPKKNLSILFAGLIVLGQPKFSRAQEGTPHLFAAVVSIYDSSGGTRLAGAGVYRAGLEAPGWELVSWPRLPVRALTVFDEEHPKLLLGGDHGILRPFTNPSKWKILTDWRVRDVLDLVLDPFQPQTIYAATGLGIVVSYDSGSTWASSNRGLRETFVSCLQPDTQTPGRILAGTEAGLYESTDYGRTWRMLTLDGIAIRAILRQPIAPGVYWVGAEYKGLLMSQDGGYVFTPVALGEDSLSIYSLAGGLPGEPIVAGSFRRGLFISGVDDLAWRHLEGSEQFGTVFSIAIFDSGQRMYFGTHSNGVWRTTDGGANWEPYGLAGADVRKLLPATLGQSP